MKISEESNTKIKLENFVKSDSTYDVKSGIILHILLKISIFIPEKSKYFRSI
jgi:hypothetical protein